MMDNQSALVVDDDVNISNLLGMVLSLVGYECEIVNSTKDALSRLVATNPQLVILDMEVDTSLGAEDILFYTRANPRLKDTQVIILTAQPALAASVSTLADTILFKPINFSQLRQAIDKLMTSEKESKRDDFCDPITGTYNKDFFFSRLVHAIERAKRRPEFIFGVCIIDMNLSLPPSGEPIDPLVYNTVMRDATQSLIHNLRPTDTVARLSHAKFATLHEELRNADDIGVIIKRLRTILMPPFRVDNRLYSLSIRIGKATSEDPYQTAEDILYLAEKNRAL